MWSFGTYYPNVLREGLHAVVPRVRVSYGVRVPPCATYEKSASGFYEREQF